MEEDLMKNLIYRGYEGRNVEYKSGRPWNNENTDERIEIIRAVLAFANAGGGYIIIGYDENKPIAEQRTGINEEYLRTWDSTNVNKKINNYCMPILNIEVITYTDSNEDKRYIILDIPAAGKMPFICVRQAQNGKGVSILRKGAVYYRTKNNTCEEISEPDEFEELLQRCLLNRTDELQRYFSQMLKGEVDFRNKPQYSTIDIFKEMNIIKKDTEKYNPHEKDEDIVYVELIAKPINSRRSFASDKVDIALSKASKNYGGWPFIFYLRSAECAPKAMDDRIHAYNNIPFYDRKVFDYWVFLYDSGIFYSRYLTFDCSKHEEKFFDPLGASRFLGEVLIAIGKLYNMLEIQLDEDIIFGIRYYPTNGIKVSSGGRYNLYESPIFEDKQLTFSLINKLSNFLNAPEDIGSFVIYNLIKKMQYPGGLGIEFFKNAINEHLSNPKFDH